MANNSKLIGADYLLLLLYLNNKEPIKSAVRITKMMFLFNEEIVPLLKKKGVTLDEKDLPEFIAYNYGPFSKDLYEQIELFQNIGFIKVTDLYAKEEMDEADDWEEESFIDELDSESTFTNRRDGKFIEYKLLVQGEKFVNNEIICQLTGEQIEILSAFKSRITETSVKSILRYVYVKYPDKTENSFIKDEVLGQ